MKKLALLCAFVGSLAFADMVVPATNLPKSAQDFISTNFAGANTMYVKMDYEGYEVTLSNGVKLEFDNMGNWSEIKSYTGVNPALLPNPVASALAKNFPNVQIIKVEKEWNGFEVQLANRIKAFFDANGNLMGQKYDD